MDTPNTRSRRKRELNELGEEDEGGQVEWREDQHIRRLLARATADVPIPIPSPTQRPIFGRSPAISTGDSAASSSTTGTTKPPRKRPCRPHRSLPSQLSLAAGPSSNNRSNSLPSKADDGVLDDLLDRAFRTFSVKPNGATVARKSSSNAGEGSGNHVGFGRTISGGSMGGGSTTSGSEISPVLEISDPVRLVQPMEGSVTTRPALNNKPIVQNLPRPQPQLRSSQTSKPPIRPKTSSPSNPTSVPSKVPPYPKSPNNRPCPRVGLSSRPKPTNIPPNAPLGSKSTRAPAGQQRFKPPFINPGFQQPIRCSPRRHPQTHIPSSSSQTPSRPTTTTLGRDSPIMAQPQRGEKVELATAYMGKLAKNAPSSDSVGDESFDSFDGIFQAGGEDIEALMRTVDGS